MNPPYIEVGREELKVISRPELFGRFGFTEEPETKFIRPPPPLSKPVRVLCAVVAVALLPFWVISRAIREEP
jgi:hypothetical protein